MKILHKNRTLVSKFFLYLTFHTGYWGIPLFGYLPLFDKTSFEEHLADLQKQHGDIIR